MKLLITLMLIFIGSINISEAKQDPKKANELALQAIELMNEHEFKEAIYVLEEAEKLDTNNIKIPYEKALAYYKLKDFEKAIFILSELGEKENSFPEVYQLLSASLKSNDNNSMAISTLEDALKKFPNSGKLYMELGICYYGEEFQRKSMGHWELGILKDPNFDGNYLFASRVYKELHEPLWVMFYSETIMNLTMLESYMKEASEMIYDAYDFAYFENTSGSLVRVSMNLKMPEKEMAFPLLYQKIKKEAVEKVFKNQKRELNITNINKIRTEFIKTWFSKKLDKVYDIELIKLQKKLLDNKLLTAYNYWLLQLAAPKEFAAWYKNNQKTYKKLFSFMAKNQLKLNNTNVFRRSDF